MPKGDAKMLGVEPSGGHWSACDEQCVHAGPIRVKTPPFYDDFTYFDGKTQIQILKHENDLWVTWDVMLEDGMEAEWRILDCPSPRRR